MTRPDGDPYDSPAVRPDGSVEHHESAIRQKAKRYQATRLRLVPVRLLVGITFLLLSLTGPSQRLAAYLNAVLGNWAAAVAAYFIVFTVAYTIWQLPLNFYQGYAVEKRFGLSTEQAVSWFLDWVKGLFVSVVVGLPIVVIVYWLLRELPQWWWVAAGIVMTVFGVVLANLAPVLIYPLFLKFEPLEDEEVRGRLSSLANKSGTAFSGIYRMELSVKSKEAEAMLTGMGRTRRIVLSDTLLTAYDLDEVETILAHELGHHALLHLPFLVAAQAAGAFAALLVISMVLRSSVGHLGLVSISDVGNLPLILLVVSIMQTAAAPLGNWWSRRFEARADAFALELTNQPEAFARAMLQLADQNLADLDPSPAVEILFYSHPPIGRRVESARQFARARGIAFDLSAAAHTAGDSGAGSAGAGGRV